MKRDIEGVATRHRISRAIKAVAISGLLAIGGATHMAPAAEATTPSHGSVATVTVATPSIHARLAPRVPSVRGKSKAKAIRVLRAAGYVVRTRTKTVKQGSSGRVLSQKPAARTRLARGSRVTLTISKRAKASAASSNCTPGYSPCLPYASDYDCAGGSGNGPKYVSGTVRVTGNDPYDLDRDGDGYGCD